MEPLALFAPLQSSEAVQEVGLLVAFQLSTAELPTVMVPGLTLSETIGGLGNTTTTAVSEVLPALLLQVSL
jgi:hypothetical protein